MMKLFDLHCDSLLCAYLQKTGLHRNGLHLDLDKTRDWDAHGQVLAVFSQHELSPDEAYEQCGRVLDYYKAIRPESKNFTPVFGVEGGKLLGGDISRLDALYDRGIRILTLVWADTCCIGGAFNTNVGLTDFGRDVVSRCFALGILPDISHASLEMTEQTLCMAETVGKPILASHSCFRALHDHPRNLTDEHARRIASLGGVIGVNLVIDHLGGGEACDIDRVVDHLLYGVNLCGEEAICLGCDLDGTDLLPKGITGVCDLPLLRDRLAARTHSEDLTDAIFYDNAASFLGRTLTLP